MEPKHMTNDEILARLMQSDPQIRGDTGDTEIKRASDEDIRRVIEMAALILGARIESIEEVGHE